MLLRPFLTIAAVLFAAVPSVYVFIYTLICSGNEKCKATVSVLPELSPTEQLHAMDAQYFKNLTAQFWRLTRPSESGTELAREFSSMMAEYKNKRSVLLNDTSAMYENDFERLLYLQQFIIDFAEDPDSRNASELEEGLKKYGNSGSVWTIGLDPECLVPYPRADKLFRMYYKAIHFKLEKCVKKVPDERFPLQTFDARLMGGFIVFLQLVLLLCCIGMDFDEQKEKNVAYSILP